MKKKVFSSFKKVVGFEDKVSQFLIKTIWLKKKMFPTKMFLLNFSVIANRAISNFEFYFVM